MMDYRYDGISWYKWEKHTWTAIELGYMNVMNQDKDKPGNPKKQKLIITAIPL
jgi:hypothetical protein